MTWTYTDDLSNDRDFVRYKLGDRTQTAQSPSDENIAYWLEYFEGDKYKTAAELARNLATTYRTLATSASEGTVKIGGMSLEGEASTYRQAADHYADLAESLEAREETGTGPTSPGYIERPSIFSIGMMDNSGYKDWGDIVR